MKKAISIFLVSLFAVATLTTTASAYGNIADREFSLPFGFGDCFFSEFLEKQDDTSTYMHVTTDTDNSMTVEVYGASDNFYDVGSPEYVLYGGSERWMVNYVYENGYPSACFVATANFSGFETIEGVWSPDSI